MACVLSAVRVMVAALVLTGAPSQQSAPRSPGEGGYDPKPNPKAVVEVFPQARFTVLTQHLIRMEWGGNRDQPTLAFVNRNLPVPDYSVTKAGEWTVIHTAAITVREHGQPVPALSQV